MRDPARVRLTGPLEPYARGFAAELARQGYTQSSAVVQLDLAAHLSRWAVAQGLDPAQLSSGVLEEYLAARRGAGGTRHLTARALAPLLGYLRALGAVPPPELVAPQGPVEELLERYRAYLTGERGLGAATARGYVDAVRPFLAGRARSRNGLDLGRLTAGAVTEFVVAECRRQGRAKLMVTALRSLLGHLHAEGAIPAPLAQAVPSVAGWRLAGLPRALEPGQVSRLLACCERRSAGGLRDLAILTLLARLGLRAGEVAQLELDDVDWRCGELVVRGKGGRCERLPLPVDAGQALAAYLRRGRPGGADCRRLFLRVRAPQRGLGAGAVTHVVSAAARRAGLPSISAHRLRHTAATEMLRAGAPLSEIGQLLRHRHPQTTAIYAKVDREALRTLARPWPGGAP